MIQLIPFLLLPFLGVAVEPGQPVQPCVAAFLVRTTNSLSSQSTQPGSPWQGFLETETRVGSRLVAPRGAAVSGLIVESTPSPARLRLELNSLAGQPLPPAFHEQIGQRKDRGAKRKMTGWAITGALVGGILSGGKGAAAGAAAGAAVGAARSAGRAYEAAEIPAESLLSFTVNSPRFCQSPD